MICLNNTDTLEGGASVNNVVDYTVYGVVGTTFTLIAEGKLSDTDPSVLYTAPSAVSIVSIVLVNTHSSAVTVNLYLDPGNAGTPRRLIAKNLSLGSGYALHFDGQRCAVLDQGGNLMQSAPTAGPHHTNHEDGGSDEINIAGLDGEPAALTAHKDLTTGVHGVGASDIESTSGSQSKVDAHNDLTTGVHGVGVGTIAKVEDIAVDSNLSSAAQDAISKQHDRSHSLISTSDHTSSATEGKILKANADGLPIDATNTDDEVADAVSKKHTQGTDTALGAVGTKDSPIDDDKALYRDSESSDALVTSTWTQVKAFLKTYFDTVYATITHKSRHEDGGDDEISVSGLSGVLADAQKVKVRINSGGSDVGARPRLNFIEGSNVDLTITDDDTDNEIDITISATGGGGGGAGAAFNEFLLIGA